MLAQALPSAHTEFLSPLSQQIPLGLQLSGVSWLSEGKETHPPQCWSAVWDLLQSSDLLSKQHAGSFKGINFQILKICIFKNCLNGSMTK